MGPEDNTARLRSELVNAPPVTPLRPDRPRQSAKAFEPLVSPVALSSSTQDVLAVSGDLVSNAVLLGAVASLVYRYTGDTELLIGLAGDGLTLLPWKIHADLTVPELLDAATAAARDGLGPIGGDELLSLRATDAHVQQPPCHAVVAPRNPGHAEHVDHELRYADLVVLVGEFADGPRIALACNGTLFEQSTLDRIAGHFGRLIGEIARDPGNGTVDTVSLLSKQERHRAVVEWNDTTAPVPPRYAHELVSLAAFGAPDSPAVVHDGVTTSFGQLDEDANRMASHLGALGVGPGDNVAVLLERGAPSLIAQLAIFKNGAAVVLMAPENTPEQLRYMLIDSGTTVVVTRSGLAEMLAGCAVTLVDVDSPEWLASPAVDPRAPVEDDSVSHVAYTSGSTGVPKAVMLRHGALRNTIHVLREECELNRDSKGTWMCSPGFGLVEVDCFPVLASGAAVHVPDPSIVGSPRKLRDWLVNEGITHTLQLTPMAERLWTLHWPQDCALKSMRVAGERVKSWPPPDIPFTVLNVYGSAEANVVATCDLVATAAGLTGDQRMTRVPPVGRPVPNVRTYVLDSRFVPVPPGVVGELYISGNSLSRGYLRRPDADQAKFLANPLPEDPNPVLYRSGDLARYWPDGVIEVVGRVGDEVGNGGYAGHLAEVENALAALPGVQKCVVLARNDDNGRHVLVGYVEPDPAAPPLVADLRRAIAKRLPTYLWPSSYVIDVLPLNNNGKIDREGLLPPPARRVTSSDRRAELMGRLTKLWCDVLDIDNTDHVDALDEFFALGGDSASAMQLLVLLRGEFGVELDLADLLRAQTVEATALLIEQAGLWPEADMVLHDALNRFTPFPLTPSQQVMWAPGRLADLYEWEFDSLDVDRFVDAWNWLTERYDPLRTIFTRSYQQVLSVAPAPLVLSEVDDPGARDISRAALRRTLRPHVLRIAPLPSGRWLVQLALQPLLIDADSAHRLLIPELFARYDDPSSVRAAPEITFRDFALTTLARWEQWSSHVGEQYEVVPQPCSDVARHRVSEVSSAHWEEIKRLAEVAGAEPEGVLVAALHDTLRAHPLPGAEQLPSLARTAFRRASVDPRVADVVGHFAGPVRVSLPPGEDPAFAERARELGDGPIGGVGSGFLVTVVHDHSTPGGCVVLSRNSMAMGDVRILIRADSARVGWTVPDSVPDAQIDLLTDDYRRRLGRLAEDGSLWWPRAGHDESRASSGTAVKYMPRRQP